MTPELRPERQGGNSTNFLIKTDRKKTSFIQRPRHFYFFQKAMHFYFYINDVL